MTPVMHPSSRAGAALAALTLLAAPAAGAQRLATRVDAVRDGRVAFEMTPRPGVCGNGRDMIRAGDATVDGHTFVWSGSTSFDEVRGSYRGDDGAWCEPGPLRVVITRRDGAVDAVRATVGPVRDTAGTSDLGAIDDEEGVDYLLGLARTLDGRAASDALLPAVLADRVSVWSRLITLGRDAGRPDEVRGRALAWAGRLGGDSAVSPLATIARDTGAGRRARRAALVGLAESESDAGVDALIALARTLPDAATRKGAIFWLGQTRAPRALAALRDIIASGSDEDAQRAAVFALSQGSDAPDDADFLHRQFARLTSERVRDQILFALSQMHVGDQARWLLGVAADGAQPTAIRKKALFWAAQGHAPTADLARFYDDAGDEALRRQAIFVLSQRDDAEAGDKLIAIAKSDPSLTMRKQALFWLGQRHDPRAAALIEDLLKR